MGGGGGGEREEGRKEKMSSDQGQGSDLKNVIMSVTKEASRTTTRTIIGS